MRSSVGAATDPGDSSFIESMRAGRHGRASAISRGERRVARERQGCRRGQMRRGIDD